jgi:hypothetical protein
VCLSTHAVWQGAAKASVRVVCVRSKFLPADERLESPVRPKLIISYRVRGIFQPQRFPGNNCVGCETKS